MLSNCFYAVLKLLLLSPNDSVAVVTLENEELLYASVTDSRVIYCERSFPKRTLRQKFSSGDKVFPSSPKRNLVDDSCHPKSLLA